jgi:hypothetical protein
VEKTVLEAFTFSGSKMMARLWGCMHGNPVRFLIERRQQFQLRAFRQRPLSFTYLRRLCELLENRHGACGVVHTLVRLGASFSFGHRIVLGHWLLLLLARYRFLW